jgi:hypothetical protein
MLHSELHPKWYNSNKGVRTATRIEGIEIEGSFDVDESLVCTTPQQPRESREKIALP